MAGKASKATVVSAELADTNTINQVRSRQASTNDTKYGIVANEYVTYTNMLAFFESRSRDQSALFTQALIIARSRMPFKEKWIMTWNYYQSSRNFTNILIVVSNLASSATTLNERHSYLVILGPAAAHFKEYDKGIEACNTIVDEQKRQDMPNPGNLVGAYQNLSTLYGLKGAYEDSVTAARAAKEWWRKVPGSDADTDRESGMEQVLGEALANAGHFDEAEQVYLHLIHLNPKAKETYSQWISVIRLYKENRKMWNPNKPVIIINR